MSVDLRSTTFVGRFSFVIMDDSLIKLEHGYTQDRVRKYLFDGIEAVIIWQKPPWLHIIVWIVLFGIPGFACLFSSVTGVEFFGASLIALAALLVTWYFYCGRTTIRIVRSGRTDDITGIFRPSRRRRFRDRLVAGIQRVQQASGAAEPATNPSGPSPESPPIDQPPPIPQL